MAANMGRRIPGGAESLVMSVDAANDKCQSRNLYLCPSWGEPGFTQTSGNMQVDGTGNLFRVPIGTVIGGYEVTGTDIVYGYTLGTNGCHYKGWDVIIGNGHYTFAFDYFVTTDANNFPTVNYLANMERKVGGSAATNSIKGKWQTIAFSGNNTGIGTIRPLLYPGACSSSYLASSGTLYYRNPRLTQSPYNSIATNDFDTNVGGSGGSYSYRLQNDLTRMYDMVSGNFFGGVSDNGRPLESYEGGGSWDFSAGTDYWTMAGANTQLDNQNYTIEVWIKTDATSQNGFWFEKGSVNTQYSLFQEGSRIVHRTRFTDTQLHSQYTTTSSFINTNNWYHVVATFDGSTKKTYIDGVRRSVNGGLAKTVATNSNGVWIGRYGNGSSYQYNGKLAKCNVYNRALTEDEVSTQFRLDRVRFGK